MHSTSAASDTSEAAAAAPPSAPSAPSAAAGAALTAACALPLLALALVLNLAHLGGRSLLGDEAIYANPAREAVLHGQWYPLTVRGNIYWSKPPLCVWPVAVAFRCLGIDETADRVPSALAGVALVGLVYGFAAWLLGRWPGLLAAALLATCRPWLFTHGVRDGVGDPLLCLLLTAALLLYLHFRTTGRRRWLLLAGLAAALSGLVKDLVGPLFLLVILAAWELLRERWAAAPADAPMAAPTNERPAAERPRRRRRWLSRLGAPLALAGMGVGPYLVWCADNLRRRRDLFIAYEHRNLVERHTHGLAAVHVHGIGYYPAVLRDAFGHWWLAILPAALAWAAARRRGGARSRAFLLLAAWIAAVFATLSLSASSLTWYLEPTYPPIAILIAAGCGEVARRLGRRRLPSAAFALVVCGLLAARAVVAWETLSQPRRLRQLHRLVLASRELPAAHIYMGDLHPPGTLVREWSHFYLDELTTAVRTIPPVLPAGGCNIVLTATPERLAARPGFAGARILQVATEPDGESPLYILDLCGGELARRLPDW